MATGILEESTQVSTLVDPTAFIDQARPESWSRQLVALLEAGHYREAYDVLAEKVPYVENQMRHYAEHLAGRTNYWTHLHGWIDRLMGATRPMTILDVGCSIGSHAIEFARKGHETCGVDVLPQMIARGQELADSLGVASRVHLQQGDIRKLDSLFESAQFDGAVACDIFEHLDDASLMQVLQGLKRVVRPGGTIVIQTSPGLYYYWFEANRPKLLSLLTPLAWLPDRAFTAYVRWLDRVYIRKYRCEPTTFYRHEHGHINCMDHVHLRGLLESAQLSQVNTFAVHAHPGFKDEACLRTPLLRRLFGRKSIAARNVFGVARVGETVVAQHDAELFLAPSSMNAVTGKGAG